MYLLTIAPMHEGDTPLGLYNNELEARGAAHKYIQDHSIHSTESLNIYYIEPNCNAFTQSMTLTYYQGLWE